MSFPPNRHLTVNSASPFFRQSRHYRRVRFRDGGEGNRTPDLLNAIQALSQLSYTPGIFLSLASSAGGTAKDIRG